MQRFLAGSPLGIGTDVAPVGDGRSRGAGCSRDMAALVLEAAFSLCPGSGLWEAVCCSVAREAVSGSQARAAGSILQAGASVRGKSWGGHSPGIHRVGWSGAEGISSLSNWPLPPSQSQLTAPLTPPGFLKNTHLRLPASRHPLSWAETCPSLPPKQGVRLRSLCTSLGFTFLQMLPLGTPGTSQPAQSQGYLFFG